MLVGCNNIIKVLKRWNFVGGTSAYHEYFGYFHRHCIWTKIFNKIIFFFRSSVSESPPLDDSSGYPSVPQYPKDVDINQVNDYLLTFCLTVLWHTQKWIRFCLIQLNDVQAGPTYINLCICLAYSRWDHPLGKTQIVSPHFWLSLGLRVF